MANSVKQHELVVANQLINVEGWHPTPFVAKALRIREVATWCIHTFGAMYSDITELGDWYGFVPDESDGVAVGAYFIFRREQDLTAFLLRWS